MTEEEEFCEAVYGALGSTWWTCRDVIEALGEGNVPGPVARYRWVGESALRSIGRWMAKLYVEGTGCSYKIDRQGNGKGAMRWRVVPDLV
jgi:hypothetical protein